ncbi:extracellular catalytic domain type 1 short-chain-length polyhydroxyalkanoate depolymerase [Streptomyces tibetensis]|uniref:extracellular catalytic domain type 1 short-chain-length polyhydroxyalkanoate depolymerase n=1 Tax=Streptomyces tibetensis TaxID=2382123 RepID=UPI0033E56EEB
MPATSHPRSRRLRRPLLLALVAALLPLLVATVLTAPVAAADEPTRGPAPGSARKGAVPAAALTEVTNFGTNPSNLRMYLYVPESVTPKPAVVVAVHWCTGSGPDMYNGTEYDTLADRYGFIVLYPSVTRSSKCFDVSSPQALRRGGGSDPVGIKSMIDWVTRTYDADTGRVFATGISSGAMMTNVLLGDYPDVFAAGAAFSGVPFGCFATTDGSEWNSACSGGTVTRTAQEWGDLARGAYPGYTGPRPRMQIWHGTEDDALRYPNFGEQIKQWTNVQGVSQTPAATDTPQPGWTRTRYGGTSDRAPVEAISLQGVGHNLYAQGMASRVLTFFGLEGSGPGPQPQPGACRVTASVNSWNTGLTASVTLTNTGTTTVNGWKAGFTLPAGQTVTGGWGATYAPTSGSVTATNVSYNGTIAPGASVNFGYQASHAGNSAAPTAFTLNGTACATG